MKSVFYLFAHIYFHILPSQVKKWDLSFTLIWNTIVWLMIMNFFVQIVNSTAQRYLKKQQEKELASMQSNESWFVFLFSFHFLFLGSLSLITSRVMKREQNPFDKLHWSRPENFYLLQKSFLRDLYGKIRGYWFISPLLLGNHCFRGNLTTSVSYCGSWGD